MSLILHPLPISSLPGDQNSSVVIGNAIVRDGIPVAVTVHDGLLPLAEAVEGLAGMVVDL